MILQLWICSINVGFRIIFFTFHSPHPKVLFRVYKCLLRGQFRSLFLATSFICTTGLSYFYRLMSVVYFVNSLTSFLKKKMYLHLQFSTEYFHIPQKSSLEGPAFGLCSAWQYGTLAAIAISKNLVLFKKKKKPFKYISSYSFHAMDLKHYRYEQCTNRYSGCDRYVDRPCFNF